MRLRRTLIGLTIVFYCSCAKETVERNVFFGDSHIARWDLESAFPFSASGNHGKSGAEINLINQLIESFPGTKEQHCFVEAGTNDLRNRYMAHVPDSIILSHMDSVYQQLLNTISVRFDRCYILAIIPPGNNWSGGVKLCRKANERLQQLVQHYANVVYLPLPGLENENGKMKDSYDMDGIHLNAEGYKVLSAYLRPYVY